ncbi:hypothetical protein D6029_12690 [Buttiauxella izardii]|uniref:Uncharacterized protein n=1 Tax=Buttiauxella izardii TaxID=82991 RepID=A0A3A5JRN5_9ENTR|nr:hypothetical protein D6029_12690 [Buttiauxella izardii]
MENNTVLQSNSSRPPLNNLYIWLLVLCPIFFIPIKYLQIYSNPVIFISLELISYALAIILFIKDRISLTAAGYTKLPHWIWIFFSPVYYWKRDNITKSNHTIFWCGLIIPLICATLTFPIMEEYENLIYTPPEQQDSYTPAVPFPNTEN